MEFFDVYLAGYIKDKEELAEAIKNQKTKKLHAVDEPGPRSRTAIVSIFWFQVKQPHREPVRVSSGGAGGPGGV